jgi:hypothetical protein
METANIPKTQESLHVKITNEDNADNLLWYQGTVYLEFITQGQTLNEAYYVEILKQLCEAVHRKGLNCGPMIGFSTMTMLQLTRCTLWNSFWPKNWLLKWKTYPVPLIWLQMTSDCFQK